MIRVCLEELINIERLRMAGCKLDQNCVADSAAPFVLTQLRNPYGEIRRSGSTTYVALVLRLTFRKRLHFSSFSVAPLQDGANFSWSDVCEEHSPAYCMLLEDARHLKHANENVLNPTLKKPGILDRGMTLRGVLLLQAETQSFKARSQLLALLICREISGVDYRFPVRLRFAGCKGEEAARSTGMISASPK